MFHWTNINSDELNIFIFTLLQNVGLIHPNNTVSSKEKTELSDFFF